MTLNLIVSEIFAVEIWQNTVTALKMAVKSKQNTVSTQILCFELTWCRYCVLVFMLGSYFAKLRMDFSFQNLVVFAWGDLYLMLKGES